MDSTKNSFELKLDSTKILNIFDIIALWSSGGCSMYQRGKSELQRQDSI